MASECKICGTNLIRDSNWTEGSYKKNDYRCSSCRASLQREYYHRNKPRIRECQKKRYEENKDEILKSQRELNILKSYGLTVEEYDEMMRHPCQICGKNEDKVLDHCHESGSIRGVLCRQCNMGVGLLGDNINGLESAIEYLRNSEI